MSVRSVMEEAVAMKAEATEVQLEKTRAHLQHKVNLFEEAATEVRACDVAT